MWEGIKKYSLYSVPFLHDKLYGVEGRQKLALFPPSLKVDKMDVVRVFPVTCIVLCTVLNMIISCKPKQNSLISV